MKVAVVGATGMVGEIMLKVLAERNFPVTELIPVASEKSVGKEINWNGNTYKVVGLQTAVDMNADIALFSSGISGANTGYETSCQGFGRYSEGKNIGLCFVQSQDQCY